MKTILHNTILGSALSLLLGLLAVSCKTDKADAPRMQVLDLPKTLTFDATPTGTETFTVDAREIWIIKRKDLDWVSFDPANGGSGKYTINLSAEVNEWEFPREGELIIESPSFKKVIKVIQDPAIIIGAVEFADVEEDVLRIPALAGEYSFTATANLEWKTSLRDLPWGIVSPAEGVRKTPTTVILAAEANEVTEPRTGYIDFTLSDGSVVSIAVEQAAFDAEISLSESAATASASGSVDPQVITVTANAGWTASCEADWLTIDPSQGPAGDTQVSFSASENTTMKDREAKVVFDNHGLKTEFTVTQYWETLDLTPGEVALNYQGTGSLADGSPCKVSVKASGDWSVTSSDWISVTPASGTGDAVITITASLNDSNERQGEVVVKCGRLSRSITVSQDFYSPFIDLAAEGEIVWITKSTKAEVQKYSPEWETKAIALPSTHADLAYCKWTPSQASLDWGFDQLYVIASNGDIVSRNNWTDDALVFHIPVLSIPAGKMVRFLFNLQGLGGQPAYWAAEVNVNGTWYLMDTGTSYKTPNLGTDANIYLSTTKTTPFDAQFVLPDAIEKTELQVRIRVADGTYSINKTTISNVAGKSSSLRFQANSVQGTKGIVVRVQ